MRLDKEDLWNVIIKQFYLLLACASNLFSGTAILWWMKFQGNTITFEITFRQSEFPGQQCVGFISCDN
jgi:hypothetical protein